MDDADDADRDPEIDERRRLDAELVERVRAGDESAFGEIYDTWFDRVHDLALRIVRSPETASEVAQDTFLAAWQKLDTLEQPASFGGWLLRIARNRALNRSEREKRSTAVGDDTMAVIEAGGELMSAPAGFRVEERVARADDPAIATEDNEVADLLWSAAAALGERDQTVLTLQLRFGMTPAEIGETMGVSRNAANQMVHRVKGRLDSAVQARVLWDGDRPRCERLEAALVAAGIGEFSAEAVKIAEKHADECDECGDRRRLRLQPAALFGALPVLVAPQFLKQKVAAALAADGVPVDPARYLPGEGSGSSGADGSSTSSATGPGPDATALVAEPVPAEGGGDEPGSGGPARSRVLLAVAAGVVIIALAGVLFILGTGDGEGDESLAAGGTPEEAADDADDPSAVENDGEEVDEFADASTTAGPTTATTAAGPAPDLADAPDPAGDEADPVVPPIVTPDPDPDPGNPVDPGGPGPAPPPPGPADRIVEFSVSPSSRPGFYAVFDAPRLRWQVKPGYEAEVTGEHFSASATSGDEPVCPHVSSIPGWTFCPVSSGSYDYTLTVRLAGEVVEQRTIVLTIT